MLSHISHDAGFQNHCPALQRQRTVRNVSVVFQVGIVTITVIVTVTGQPWRIAKYSTTLVIIFILLILIF